MLLARRKLRGMKKLLAVVVTACALVGCDRRNSLIEDDKDNAKAALNDRKEAVDDSVKTAKKQADADAKTEKARLEADQQKAHAQISADKRRLMPKQGERRKTRREEGRMTARLRQTQSARISAMRAAPNSGQAFSRRRWFTK